MLRVDRNAPWKLGGRTIQFLIDVVCRACQGLPEQGRRRDRIQKQPVVKPVIFKEYIQGHNAKKKTTKDVQPPLPNIGNLDRVVDIIGTAAKNTIEHIP